MIFKRCPHSAAAASTSRDCGRSSRCTVTPRRPATPTCRHRRAASGAAPDPGTDLRPLGLYGYATRPATTCRSPPRVPRRSTIARDAIASWITETLARPTNSRAGPIACRCRARSTASPAACCCSATGPVRRPGRSTSEGRARGRARPLCACPPNPRANWPRLPHDLPCPRDVPAPEPTPATAPPSRQSSLRRHQHVVTGA